MHVSIGVSACAVVGEVCCCVARIQPEESQSTRESGDVGTCSAPQGDLVDEARFQPELSKAEAVESSDVHACSGPSATVSIWWLGQESSQK